MSIINSVNIFSHGWGRRWRWVGTASGSARPTRQHAMTESFPDTRWSVIGRLGTDDPDGDQARSLVATYADAVTRYLRLRLRDCAATLVDDVIQDVLAHLLHHPEVLARAQPGMGSRFRYYVMTLAWNEARNALRRLRPDATRTLTEIANATDQQPNGDMDRAWATSVLTAAWDELRAQGDAGLIEADVVTLTEAHLIAGRSLRDLAASGTASLATCSRRVAQGRMLLQQAIVERLRLVGEWDAQVTPAEACARMLEHFRR